VKSTPTVSITAMVNGQNMASLKAKAKGSGVSVYGAADLPAFHRPFLELLKS
jgi:hypothetical protein